jgi:hypothetical protein
MKALKQILPILLLMASCSSREEKQADKLFTRSVTPEEWTVYEGKWKTPDGLLRIELFLEEGAPGMDARFKLFESIESTHIGTGSATFGSYTIFYGLQNEEIGIRLNRLAQNSPNQHFRQSKSWFFDDDEEMYFISKGDLQLIPSDESFVPISTEEKFAMTKRLSKPFTVEGYITFSEASAEFFERNTGENWMVSNFGERDTLQTIYGNLAKEKFEGIYVKALAFVGDNDKKSSDKNTLVIKRVLKIGSEIN